MGPGHERCRHAATALGEQEPPDLAAYREPLRRRISARVDKAAR
jgi:hypothetical protein